MQDTIAQLRDLALILGREQTAARERGAGPTAVAYGVAASKVTTAAVYLEEAQARELAEPASSVPPADPAPAAAPATPPKNRR